MNLPCELHVESLRTVSEPDLLSRNAPKRTFSDNVKKIARERSPGKKTTSPPSKRPVEFSSRFDSRQPGFRPSSSPSRPSPRRSKQKRNHGSPERPNVWRAASSDSKKRLASMARKIKKVQREIESDQLKIRELAKENKCLKEKIQRQPGIAFSSQELLQECQNIEEQMLQLDLQLFEKTQNESQESLEFFLGFSDCSKALAPDLSWVPDLYKSNLSIRPLPALAPHRSNSSRTICSQKSSDERYFI